MDAQERLELLITQRDLIEAAMGSERGFIEMEVRGRRVRYEATIQRLEYLNNEIAKLESGLAARRNGPARNLARIQRR